MSVYQTLCLPSKWFSRYYHIQFELWSILLKIKVIYIIGGDQVRRYICVKEIVLKLLSVWCFIMFSSILNFWHCDLKLSMCRTSVLSKVFSRYWMGSICLCSMWLYNFVTWKYIGDIYFVEGIIVPSLISVK